MLYSSLNSINHAASHHKQCLDDGMKLYYHYWYCMCVYWVVSSNTIDRNRIVYRSLNTVEGEMKELIFFCHQRVSVFVESMIYRQAWMTNKHHHDKIVDSDPCLII